MTTYRRYLSEFRRRWATQLLLEYDAYLLCFSHLEEKFILRILLLMLD